MNGSDSLRTPVKLTEYNLAVGAYIRASHWTLVVLDLEKEVIYFYNPIQENEYGEMAAIKSSMCKFIAKCREENESDVIRRWYVTSLPHSSQSDSFNCGVYCLIFAEKHLGGKFNELTTITMQNLKEARFTIANKVMEFEVFLTDCCPKCGMAVEEQDEKLQCMSCGRSHHFKPYCVEADLKAISDGDSFCCTLCRFYHWEWSSARKYTTNNYSWIDKEHAVSDLNKYNSKETTCANSDIEIVEEKTTKMTPENKRKKKNSSRNKPKRRRSSFFYPEIKRETKEVYCVCRAPYKKSDCMWCCDSCNEWYHPKCIGRDDADTPPRAETPFMCEPCLKSHIQEWPVEGVNQMFEPFMDDEDFDEKGYFITAEDAEKHIRKAFERCWYVVHSEGEKSGVPWLQRHMTYAKLNGMKSSSGFGEGLVSQQAIHFLKMNISKNFERKQNPKAAYSLHYIIPFMANEKLKNSFQVQSGLSMDYINKVLVKEAMVVVMQEVTGDQYPVVDGELRKTEANTITKSNRLLMNYFQTERADFIKKQGHIS